MSYGMLSYLGISAQQSFRTATTSFDFVPIISETLTDSIEDLVEEGMKSRFEEGDSQEGLLTVAGDIVFEMHPILIGHVLRGVLGQASGTLVESAYNWEFLPKETDFDDLGALPPFTIEVYRDNGSAFRFTDAIFTAFNMEISGGVINKVTASVLSRVSSLATKTTPSFDDADPLLWDSASITLQGSATGDIENMTIAVDNNITGIPFLDATKLHGKYKRDGFRTFVIGGTMDFCDQVEYNNFRASSEQPMVITMTGATEVASGIPEVLKFDIPKFRYGTYTTNIAGPGRISAPFEGKAKYDSNSLYAMNTTLVNTRASYAN